MTALTEPSAGSVASSLRSTRAGWRLPALLVTKAIASGLFMVMALFEMVGPTKISGMMALYGNGFALVFLVITEVLMVAKLERPERLLRILTRPQWKSWITRGAFVLIAFSAVCATWFSLELGAHFSWWPESVAAASRLPLAVIGLPLALLTAIYRAFLFQQCEGRDLWQSRTMPWLMGVQAIMAGAAVWLLMVACDGYCDPQHKWDWLEAWHLWWLLVTFHIALFLDIQFRLLESVFKMPTMNGRQAYARLRRGPGRRRWQASMALASLAFLALQAGLLAVLILEHLFDAPLQRLPYNSDLYRTVVRIYAALGALTLVVSLLGGPLLALYSLFLYESAIIKAGQDGVDPTW